MLFQPQCRHPRAAHLTAFLILAFVMGGDTGLKAQTSPAGTPDKAALVSELTALTVEYGWTANLSRLCPAMRVGTEADCRFKQVSVSASPAGTIDNHGFNVQVAAAGSEPALLLFHLGPLIGNFFLVSPQGEIKAAFYRAKGVDFTEIPIAEASAAFETSLKFWRDNLPILKEQAAKGGLAR